MCLQCILVLYYIFLYIIYSSPYFRPQSPAAAGEVTAVCTAGHCHSCQAMPRQGCPHWLGFVICLWYHPWHLILWCDVISHCETADKCRGNLLLQTRYNNLNHCVVWAPWLHCSARCTTTDQQKSGSYHKTFLRLSYFQWPEIPTSLDRLQMASSADKLGRDEAKWRVNIGNI